MPPVSLSWDLFIVAFFAIGMSFVFIVGKDQAIKAIVGVYIAIIATQGITTVAVRLMHVDSATSVASDPTLVSLGKVFALSICFIIYISRSGIDLTHDKGSGKIMNIVTTGLFGFALCGLIVSTVLLYAIGSGILGSVPLTSTFLTPYLQGSTLVQLLLVNQDVWFTLPAFLVIAVGLMPGE